MKPPTLSYPVKNHHIEQGFGNVDPQYKGFYELFDDKHPGVDFDISEGTEVFSAWPGIVIRKEFHKGMGNVIGTRNGNIVILYAHLSEIKIDFGEVVNPSQLIALSGNTGAATTGAHLHFEMRDITKKELKDQVFDPLFGKKVSNWKEKFSYIIDNTNTQKTFAFLATRYFGDEKYWEKIAQANPNLEYKSTDLLPQDLEVIIPNY